MSLWDYLKPKNKWNEYAKNMKPLVPVEGADSTGSMPDGQSASFNLTEPPKIDLVQLEGGPIAPSRPRLSFGERLSNNLLGHQAAPTDNTGIEDGTLNVTISENPRRGGILPDIANGFRENRNNPISFDNFGQNELVDGRQKGFAYRLGEGFGSLARIGENPLGRGLIVGGLVGATGGSPLEMLAYGAQTGMLNQQNRMNDRLYRNDLISSYEQQIANDPKFNSLSTDEQQAILQNMGIADPNNITEEQTQQYQNKANSIIAQKQADAVDNYRNYMNKVHGYINENSYGNLLKAQQLRDNAAYRQMYYNMQQDNYRQNQQFRRDQLEWQKQNAADQLAYHKQQDAAMREYRNAQLGLTKRGQDMSYAATIAQNNRPPSFSEISSIRKEFGSIPAIKNYNEIRRQMQNVDSVFKKYQDKGIKANANDQILITTLNKILDPTSVVRESEFDRTAQGQALIAKIAGYAQKLGKGGSGLTSAEREDLYNAMKTMYTANEREAQVYVSQYKDMAQRYRINPDDIIPRTLLYPHGASGIKVDGGTVFR